MSTPPHDDTGHGSVTQGGGRDADGPGPARVQGRSIWWIAAVAVVLLAVAIAWLTGPKPKVPGETGSTPVTGAAGGAGAKPSAP